MLKSLRLLQTKHTSVLGIDISSTYVKFIELSWVDGQYFVLSYGYERLPEDAMDGILVKNIDDITLCVQNLLGKSTLFYRPFLWKQAVLAVPDSCTITKTIQVSNRLTERDIEALVSIEIDNDTPYPMEDIYFDFKRQSVSGNSTTLCDLLIVASRAEHVRHRVDALKRAGLLTTIVDVESYAICRVIQFISTRRPHQNKIIAVFDIGAIFTNLFVLDGKEVVYTREDRFGGEQLLALIEKRNDMTSSEAKVFIDRLQCNLGYDDELVLQFRELLLLHIKRALQFFYSSKEAKTIDRIMITGGVAKLAYLTTFLEEQLSIPTEIVNPFVHMEFAETVDREAFLGDASLFTMACGLALRAC